MLYYSGIGATETPQEILDKFSKVGQFLCKKGFILRSGHAPGADYAFEKFLDFTKKVAEIYLPWNNFGFNNVPKAWHDGINYFTFTNFDKKIQDKAMKLAENIHGHWEKCSDGARLLLARDVNQCLGLDLKTKSQFVVCWTPGAEEVGGSKICIKIAKKNKIPVYNFGDEKQIDKFREFAKTL